MDRNLRVHTFSWSGTNGEYQYCQSGNDVLTLECGPEHAAWRYSRNMRNPVLKDLTAPKGHDINLNLAQARGAGAEDTAAVAAAT